jgi:hypothetical protein
VLCFFATEIVVAGFWKSEHDTEFHKVLTIIKDWALIFSLLISGLVLLYLLNKMYREDYDLQRNQIILFILSEILVNVILLVHKLISTSFSDFLVHLFTKTGLRTVVQAYGFLYLKVSKDPLEGIQDLEFMHLVSNIQKTTTKYLPQVRKTIKWSSLTDAE